MTGTSREKCALETERRADVKVLMLGRMSEVAIAFLRLDSQAQRSETYTRVESAFYLRVDETVSSVSVLVTGAQ